MKKINLFICHRPYHILRSADIVHRYYQSPDYSNILFKFSVIDIVNNNYKEIKSLHIIEKMFNEIVSIDRSDDVSIWHIFQYLSYQKNKEEEFSKYVSLYHNFDNIYFFSDLEKPVEILVGMMREHKRKEAKIILVDEGVAAYHRSRKRIGTFFKHAVLFIFPIKYINTGIYYGESSLYDMSLATFPEKSYFHGETKQLLPISFNLVSKIVEFIGIDIDVKKPYLLYLSSLLYQNYGIKLEDEIKILRNLLNISEDTGYAFYIKPHPVQPIDDYKQDAMLKGHVIESNVPAELLMNENCCVVSLGSSAVINAVMQGVKVIDLSDLFNVKNITYRDLVSVFSPKNISDISTYLQERND